MSPITNVEPIHKKSAIQLRCAAHFLGRLRTVNGRSPRFCAISGLSSDAQNCEAPAVSPVGCFSDIGGFVPTRGADHVSQHANPADPGARVVRFLRRTFYKAILLPKRSC